MGASFIRPVLGILCSVNCSSLEVTAQGTWELIKEIKDPELMKLAEELPNIILHSQVDSITKKYLYAFRRWKSWCSHYSFNHFPAHGHHIALFLQYLDDSTSFKASVEEACNALAWIHLCAGLRSPVSEPFVKSTLGGLRRLLAKPVTKKKPVTVEMLEALVQNQKNLIHCQTSDWLPHVC